MWNQKTYDAIVVGTGAAGGFAAKELSEGGLEILVLEAGPRLDAAKDFKTHSWPYEMPFRGFDRPGERERSYWNCWTPRTSMLTIASIRTRRSPASPSGGCFTLCRRQIIALGSSCQTFQ